MGIIPPAPHLPRIACPRCGTHTPGEPTGAGIVFVCPRCGLEWVEAMPLGLDSVEPG